MKNKKNTAVVFGLTKEFLFAVACVMLDLKKHSPNMADEIVILHDGVSKKQQSLINEILPTRFIKYEFPIRNKSIFDKRTLKYFSKMVFSKYECLRLLREYKNVVWLDYDIVIKRDISELISFCDSGIKMMFPGCKVLEQLNQPVEDYRMNDDGICGSCFVFQDHLPNYDKMHFFCYDKAEKYGKYLRMGEQAIFDFMIQEFSLNVCKIDSNLYSVHPRETSKIEGAKIIHSAGPAKFWNEIYDAQWQHNYKKCISMGIKGYNYKKYLLINNIKKMMIKFKLYDFFKNIIIELIKK